MKASIRRRRTPDGQLAEGWDVFRPAFGFRASTEVTTYSSWKAAVASFEFDTGSASASSERAPRPPASFWNLRGDIRMDSRETP